MRDFPGGVWPVVLTPFKADGSVDERGLRALVDWYVAQGADGLFAASQSGEIFHLSFDERKHIARIVVDQVEGRVPVVASGHVGYALADQVRDVEAMAESGVDAVVLLTNRLAGEDEPDDAMMDGLDALIARLDPKIALGIYECPLPHKRLISLDALRACAASGRFCFLKDSCCDARLIRRRLAALADSPLKLFNANTATLLPSLRDGAAGYSGAMANFHPALYGWLIRNIHAPEAELLQAALTSASLLERQLYPANAKYHLRSVAGLPIQTACRVQDGAALTETIKSEIHQTDLMIRSVASSLGISGGRG